MKDELRDQVSGFISNLKEKLPGVGDKIASGRPEAVKETMEAAIGNVVYREVERAIRRKSSEEEVDKKAAEEEVIKHLNQHNSYREFIKDYKRLILRDNIISREQEFFGELERAGLRRRLKYRMFTGIGIALIFLGTYWVAGCLDINLPMSARALAASAG